MWRCKVAAARVPKVSESPAERFERVMKKIKARDDEAREKSGSPYRSDGQASMTSGRSLPKRRRSAMSNA